jgi:hypothetical protein
MTTDEAQVAHKEPKMINLPETFAELPAENIVYRFHLPDGKLCKISYDDVKHGWIISRHYDGGADYFTGNSGEWTTSCAKAGTFGVAMHAYSNLRFHLTQPLARPFKLEMPDPWALADNNTDRYPLCRFRCIGDRTETTGQVVVVRNRNLPMLYKLDGFEDFYLSQRYSTLKDACYAAVLFVNSPPKNYTFEELG